jgi:cell division protein ZapA
MSATGIQQVEVQIMGQSYVLACPQDGEAALREAVERVDGAMCRIRDAGKVKARDRIAVLAALNIAFELAQKEHGGTLFRNSSFGPAEAAPAETAPSSEDSRLQALLSRLDNALADDGRLL